MRPLLIALALLAPQSTWAQPLSSKDNIPTASSQAKRADQAVHNSSGKVAIVANNVDIKRDGDSPKLTDILLTLFNGLLVLVTAGLIYVGLRQEKHLRSTARSELRAYVFMKEIIMQEVDSPEIGIRNNMRINVVWGHGGKTPTKNLLHNINWWHYEEGLPNDFNYPDKTHASPAVGLIGPEATLHSVNVDIPVGLLDHVARRLTHVYVWGWVEYDDVIDGSSRHRTEVCVEVLKDGDLMSFHPKGKFNGADHDCYRTPSPYSRQ